MFKVECYVGFNDRTWDIFTVKVPGVNDPESEAMDLMHNMMESKGSNVAFIGVFHIEPIDIEQGEIQ